MADYTTIRQDILNRITENGEGEITGLDLQGILLDMIDTTSVDINQMKQKLDDFFAASNLNDVIDNWTELESFLAGLTDTSTLVELLSYKADKVDVYTKTEADALFEFKANLKALAYKDSVSMGDISGLTDALALKLDKSGGTITGDLGVDGILTMGTLRLPNASGVSGNFDLYVGSLGSGSDIPEGGGGTISYVAIKFIGENTPYEIDANGVITLPPYPDISHLATKVELTDGLATKQDVISDLATIRAGATAGAAAATPGYVDQKIADLVGSAPETLDTLQELAEALQNDAEVIDAINASIQQKANQSDLTALATRVGTAEGAITTLQGYFSNGVAKKATADADGNIITTTYYRKDGGTIGGNAYVQGELTMNTLFLPNSSNVPSAYSLYVGSLGSGSDVPSSGGDGDTVVFTPIDSNYGILSINGTQVGALSINGHTHSQYQLQITTSNKLAYSLISGTPTSLPASDVYSWAKAATKPTYTTTEVAEGSNLYFTNARAVSALSSTLSGYLPKSGGTIEGNITLNASSSFSDSWLYFTDSGTSEVYAIGIRRPTSYYGLQFISNGEYFYLIHTGNIESYNAGSATKLQTARTIWGQSFDGTGDVSGNLDMRYSKITFGESANDYHIGWGSSNMLVYANYFGHYFTTNGSERMRIVQSGNVLIGTTTDNGSRLMIHSSVSSSARPTLGNLKGDIVSIGSSGYYGVHLWNEGSGDGFVQVGRSDGTATAYNLALQPLGGNVGIGTTDPKSKLDVNGDIIATFARFSNAAPIRFTSIGAGTYNISVIEHSSSGFIIERARKTDSSSGAIIPFIISQRGGGVALKLDGDNLSVTGNISASGYQLPTSAPSNPVSGGYYLYVGSLGSGATIS